MSNPSLIRLRYGKRKSELDNPLYLALGWVICFFIMSMAIVSKPVYAAEVDIGVAPGMTAIYVPESEQAAGPYDELISSMTKDEIYLLKNITWAEANNQSIDGQRAVMEVVFNRVLHEHYPDSVMSVLSQKGAFETWKYRHDVASDDNQDEALNLISSEAKPILQQYLERFQAKGLLPKSLKCTDFVFFDTTGHNGAYHMRIGGHWFSTE